MARNLKGTLLAVKKKDVSLADPEGASFFEKLVKDTLSSDKYKSIEFSVSESNHLKKYLMLMRYGQGSFTPIVCKNTECSFNQICPLYSFKKAPAGDPCPLEVSCLISAWQKWSEVMSVHGMNPTDPLYTHYINQLTYIDLLMQRARWSQSCNYQAPVLEVVSKIGSRGEVNTEIIENPVYTTIDRLHKMQTTILDNLTLSPRESYKKKAALKQKDESDVAMSMFRRREALKAKINDDEGIIDMPDHMEDPNVMTEKVDTFDEVEA